MKAHPYLFPRCHHQQPAPASRARLATRHLPLLALLCLLLPARGWSQCRQLVWQDEFNGTAVDTTKWQFVVGDGGFGNNELQNYQAQNAAVSGGNLVITTKYETSIGATTGKTRQYTSAKLMSKVAGSSKLQTFKYGRMEASIKLPSAGGVWPAFWMMPTPSDWPSTGEIDIMEAKHKNPTYFGGTAIGKSPSGTVYMSRRYEAGVDLSQGFHQYALEWSPNELRFYFDGTLYHTVTPQTNQDGVFPFNDSRFYLILNAAVGGTGTPYTGKVDPTPADYPTQMLVDYVRVYSGTYNYGILGDVAVYQGDQYKNYRIDPIAGASYAWTVPSGATLVSGQGTNAITVNWGTKPGNLAVTATVNGCPTATYTRAVTMSAPLVVEKVHEDFEANRTITYNSYSGTFNQAAANPNPAAPNTSATVGKYVRDPRQYDAINIRNFTMRNASDFVTGRKKIYLDVYSSAPVGSRLTLQFENSSMTAGKSYPTGRHSAYKAFTTRQNAWETLEFDFEKIVDKNVGNFDVDNVVLMTEPAVYSNATYYLDNLLVKTQPTTVVATDVLENYDGSSRVTLQSAAGTYSPGVANPTPAAPNASATVAKYVRNANQPYDALVFGAGAPGTVIPNTGKLKVQNYQLQLDVYTDAPVGTQVSINLQNQAKAAKGYPAGINSTYLARTTQQNQWETLTLEFNTVPDAALSNLSVDQLVLLFSANSNTGNTYYFDNLRVAKYVADPVYATSRVLENYDDARNLSYLGSEGTYQPVVANPASSPANPSANVGRFDRKSTAQYDALLFNSGSQLTDGAAYKAGDKAFAVDVYTTAPAGTVISCQLESSTYSRADNYPSGRHSIYQAVVQQANAWNNLVFTYNSTPDGGLADADVDKLVFLFAPNSNTSDTYYLDNIRTLAQVTNAAPTVSLTAPASNASYAAPASLTITADAADSDGTVSKVEFYQGTTLLGTDTSSPYSYAWTGVAAGTYSLTAKATDDQGAVTTSAAVSVTVTAPPVNLVLNKRTVASSQENTTRVSRYAVDGSASTRWGSAFSDDQWLYVDLGARYNVNRVKINWYSSSSLGKSYVVEVAPDSINWSPIKTVTGNTALANDWTGLAGTGRFLRVHGTQRAGSYGYSITELEVYGTAATASRMALAAAPAATPAPASELRLYPNPVTAGVTLSGLTAFPAEIGVYDVKGTLLRRHQLAQAGDAEGLDWSALPAGLYLLRATSSGTSQTLRFIKQ